MNTRNLVPDTKLHMDAAALTSSAVNSVSKKAHLLSDFNDDKHIVTVGNNCDVNTVSFEEQHNKYLEKNQTINIETRHGIIGE